MADWKDLIVEQCMDNRELALAVRKKGKRLEECMGRILKSAFERKEEVPKEIVKAAKLTPPLYMGIPGKAEIKKITEKYYLGDEK